VPFGAAVRAWFVISLQTFGGPAGQIAVMQRELVDDRQWIGQRRFLHALSYCLLPPGPEAHQLAGYSGWLLHGVRGGVVAGVLFVLPGMLAMLVLSEHYVGLGDTTGPSCRASCSSTSARRTSSACATTMGSPARCPGSARRSSA
jgi:chromate transporter